jgi:thiol-disulfide isomerase/thioredoxin
VASRVWFLIAIALSACVRVPVQPKQTIGSTEPPGSPKVGDVISFDFTSLDDRSVSAPAFRGKPAVLVFLATDNIPSQHEVDILAGLAKKNPDAAHYAFVAVESPERHELVAAFQHFFEEKTGVSLLGALADKDTLLGTGPFGDIRGLTVVVLDASGHMVFRESRIVSAPEISRLLGAR